MSHSGRAGDGEDERSNGPDKLKFGGPRSFVAPAIALCTVDECPQDLPGMSNDADFESSEELLRFAQAQGWSTEEIVRH
jgi:hypothetical protein